MRTHVGKVTQKLLTPMPAQYNRNKMKLISVVMVTGFSGSGYKMTLYSIRSLIFSFCCPFLQTPILFWPTTKLSSAPSLHVYAGRAMPVPTITTAEIGEEIPESSNTGEAESLELQSKYFQTKKKDDTRVT